MIVTIGVNSFKHMYDEAELPYKSSTLMIKFIRDANIGSKKNIYMFMGQCFTINDGIIAVVYLYIYFF